MRISGEKRSLSMPNTEIFEPYARAIAEWFQRESFRLSWEGYSLSQLQDALELFRKLGHETSQEYFRNREQLFGDHATLDAFVSHLSTLQSHVLEDGALVQLPERFWMTREESIAQCLRSDAAFTEHPELQKLLADANYSFFTGKTMATATDTLDGRYDGMPHLVTGNLVLGYLVAAYILDKFNTGTQDFHITDLGSGSGSTIAGIVYGLSSIDDALSRKISVTITGVEGCDAHINILEDTMLPAIRDRVSRLNNMDVSIDVAYADITRHGLAWAPAHIITTNYVLHRLADRDKDELVRYAMSSGNQVALLVSDMFRNTSLINRSYFNFGMNGILNPGNHPEFMEYAMREHGFRVWSVGESSANDLSVPDRKLIQASDEALRNEMGFVITGYKT